MSSSEKTPTKDETSSEPMPPQSPPRQSATRPGELNSNASPYASPTPDRPPEFAEMYSPWKGFSGNLLFPFAESGIISKFFSLLTCHLCLILCTLFPIIGCEEYNARIGEFRPDERYIVQLLNEPASQPSIKLPRVDLVFLYWKHLKYEDWLRILTFNVRVIPPFSIVILFIIL